MKRVFLINQVFKPWKNTIWYFLADVFEIINNKPINYNKKLMKSTPRTKNYLNGLPISITKDGKIKVLHGTWNAIMVISMILRAEFGDNWVEVREIV